MRLPADAPIGQEEYEIACLAWEKGLAESSILEERRMEKTPESYTRVKRALQKAVRYGLLELKPPRHTQLERELVSTFPSLDKDHVHVAVDRTAACLAAARLVAAEIDEFLYHSERQTMVIANAGGQTVRDTVGYLQRLVPIPPHVEGKELVFVSLNAAEAHSEFDRCANFLSVRLAQIYDAPGTRHFVVVKPFAAKARTAYLDTLQRIDLLISSAGSREGFVADWLGQRDRELPAAAVGDVAFHLIDGRGRQVTTDAGTKSLLEDELARAPDWEDLIQLFNKKKVLLVLAGAKAGVAGALVRSALARRAVFDARVALALLGRDGGS